MCSTALMGRSTYSTMTVATFAAISILGGCNRSISDPEQLKAIRVEAQALMKTLPPEQPNTSKNIPRDQWPAAIARLNPENVTVHAWGVGIMMKAYFDGGYGYDVPRDKTGLPMPAACYSEPIQGVFWHGPC